MEDFDNIGFPSMEDMPEEFCNDLPTTETNVPETTSPDVSEIPETAEAAETPKTTATNEKENPYEQIILAEMERRAESGEELIKNGLSSADKSIAECYKYVTEQARKKAVNGCAMIADNEVFGWAAHYYMETKEVIDTEMGWNKPKPIKADSAKPIAAETTKKKTTKNPILLSLAKKGYKATDDGKMTKTSTKNGAKTTSITDKKGKTTTIVQSGDMTFTELSLF